jgi:hypothetical protein
VHGNDLRKRLVAEKSREEFGLPLSSTAPTGWCSS